MKKKLATAAVLIAAAVTFTACGKTAATENTSADTASAAASSAAAQTASTSAAAASSAAAQAASTSAAAASSAAAQTASASAETSSAASTSAAASGTATSETASAAGSGTTASAAAPAQEQTPASLSVISAPAYDSATDSTGRLLVTGTYRQLSLDDTRQGSDGAAYSALKASLATYNTEVKKRVTGDVKEYTDYAKDSLKERGEDDFSAYQEESGVRICRADSAVLSFLESYSTYAGGAHPDTLFYSHSYDSATGAELKLGDVITDTSVLPKLLEEKLDQAYGSDTWLVDSVADTISEAIKGGADAMTLTWTLGHDGITFWFEPDSLAPHAAGSQQVTLQYDAYRDLFSEKYCNAPENYVEQLDYENAILVPGESLLDNSAKNLEVSEEADYDTGNVTVTVTYGNAQKKLKLYGYQTVPYLFSDNGKRYLCLDVEGDDDWESVYFVPLSGDAIGTMVSCDWGFGKYVPVDPENFTMETRCYLLSTYAVNARFSLHAGARPQALDTMALVSANPGADRMSPLTTKEELQVHVLDTEDGSSTTEATLPKGTKLYFYRTDARHTVDMKTEDGRIVRFSVDTDVSPAMIDGRYTEDSFEGAVYAG